MAAKPDKVAFLHLPTFLLSRSALATSTHLLVSALSPPAIQCIPWPNSNAYVSPTDPSTSQPQARTRTSLIGRMDWIVGGVTTEAKEIKKSLSSTEEADRRNETEEVEGKEKEVAVEEALKEVDLGNKGSQRESKIKTRTLPRQSRIL